MLRLMHPRSALFLLVLLPAVSQAQVLGKFPPDSLLNTQVIPHSTPVIDVIGIMRNFASYLGVRCQYCHVGEEGLPLEKFDFAKDEKRTKLVARQMMRMLEEINHRVDTLPGHELHPRDPAAAPLVTCGTCHRGVSRPVPLSTIVQDAAQAGGTDSALRAYKALRDRYYGRDAYDFGEPSLNIAAFRLGRAKQFDAALALLQLNEQFFPNSSGMYVFRGNVLLMKGDTAAAAGAYREAIKRDTTNAEAKGRLRAIGQKP